MAARSHPLIAVFGETASGKSQLAMNLAQDFNGEIICADSWTVYRGFDIGTAKPTRADQARVRHHLLDIADPAEGFNAALFQQLARAAIADVHQRGKLPILVGGTNLYMDSILYNYSFLPAVSPAIRDARNQLSLAELLEEAQTKKIDLADIDIRNKRRVIRALESDGKRPSGSPLRPHTLLIGLQTDRDQLRQRITHRVDKMLAAGLKDEVKQLSNRYGWDVEPMKGIGYREWREYYDGTKTNDQTREQIISASMNLAKRQRTWFKRNNSIHWVNHPSQAVDLATTFLSKKQ